MALMTCGRHKITYNDKLDPTCPQCAVQGGEPGEQLEAEPGKYGAPKEEA